MSFWQRVGGTVLAPFYALGGALNEATGGTTHTYNIFEARRGVGADVVYSNAVLGASLVKPDTLFQAGDGWRSGGTGFNFQLPLLNPYGGTALGQGAGALAGWGANIAGETLKGGLEGLGDAFDLPAWVIPAAVVTAAGLAAVVLLK